MPQVRETGLWATFEGRDYPATSHDNGLVHLLWEHAPAPTGFAPSPSGKWRRVVTPAQLTRLDMVYVRCSWQGHRFQVGKVDGDVAVLDLLDDDHSWAAPGVLEEVDRGRWIADAPIDELRDVTEERADVLAVNRSRYVDAGSPDVPA